MARKINLQQQRRIQQQRLQNHQTQPRGLVIARYGRNAAVEFQQHLFHCKLRQHLPGLVVGDEVLLQVENQQSAVITAVCERRSLLWRMTERQQQKNIAANINQMFVVVAPQPEPSLLLVDSYLAAAELLGFEAVLVFNKMDLSNESFTELKQVYHQLNYAMVAIDTLTPQGIEPLLNFIPNKTSIFVGQSGVGKSSIINHFMPDDTLEVGDLHHATGLGTHTTSVSRLYHTPQGGRIIDSPGIRHFSLWQMDAATLTRGFKEFLPFIGQCKFRNCTHQQELGCAILRAVENQAISHSRWQSYCYILQSND